MQDPGIQDIRGFFKTTKTPTIENPTTININCHMKTSPPPGANPSPHHTILKGIGPGMGSPPINGATKEDLNHSNSATIPIHTEEDTELGLQFARKVASSSKKC